jgi:hypothetical protein
MTLPPGSPRRYSDSETAEILRRAGEEAASNPEPGALTLVEIEQIAAEVGIDRRAVRRAAAAIERPGPSPRIVERLAGGPLRLELEQSFGAALAPGRASQAIAAVRRITGRHGHVEEESSGARVSWWTQRTASNLRVTLTAAGEATTVRIEASIGEFAAGTHAGMAASGGVAGIGAALAAGLGIAALGPAAVVVGGALGASYAGARVLVSRRVRRARSEMLTILDALAELFPAEEEPWRLSASQSSQPLKPEGE